MIMGPKLWCLLSCIAAVESGGYVMTDSNIKTAVAAWLSDATAAEATYGHISTWDTSGVTDTSELFLSASSFNEDIGAWDTSGVTRMYYMFYRAYAFDQDLGWCVDEDVSLGLAFYGTQCESTSCGVEQRSDCPSLAPTPAPTPRPATIYGYVMDDTTIRSAVGCCASHLEEYGHISTWDTSRVTDMENLFQNIIYFNEDISAWDTSSVTSMHKMFRWAEAFNQDLSNWRVENVKDMSLMFHLASNFDQELGWCVGNDVNLAQAFRNMPCRSTSCGVSQRDAIGICEWLPSARPCLIGTRNQCYITSGTLIIAIVLVLLAGLCFYHRRKASMMDKADEPSGSLPKSNPEPTEMPPAEDATPSKEEEATAVAPEAEESPQETLAEEPPPQENPVEEPPPPPAKKSWWFGRAEPEPEEAERPPPLSPFSALRAERERG